MKKKEDAKPEEKQKLLAVDEEDEEGDGEKEEEKERLNVEQIDEINDDDNNDNIGERFGDEIFLGESYEDENIQVRYVRNHNLVGRYQSQRRPQNVFRQRNYYIGEPDLDHAYGNGEFNNF